MKVRIDGFKHLVKKETGEATTIVYCSYPDSSKGCHGCVHLNPVWISGMENYVIDGFYNTLEESYVFNGKMQFKIIGFDPLPETAGNTSKEK